MSRVTLHISDDDYRLFYQYCANYCLLYDETRKNSIKILLELYKHQVIDFQENSLDNIFTFFYQKKQYFEAECNVHGRDANELMQIRMCSDIISFLEDLEKIYTVVRRKGVKANYFLIIGTFSKIIDDENQMRLEDLQEAASSAISSIVLPLGDAIEKKLGPDADVQSILRELVNFAGTFNRLSKDIKITDQIIDLLSYPLIKRFKKGEDSNEIKTLLTDNRYLFEIDEFESALEGGLHTQNEWALEFSWEGLLKPLRELTEMIARSQNRMLIPLDVLSALEAPMKLTQAQAEYSQVTLYQNPYGTLRKVSDENRILIKVGNRANSEVHLSSATDFISPASLPEYKYKQYFSITAGVLIILIIIMSSIIFPSNFAPGNTTVTTTKGLHETEYGMIQQSNPDTKLPKVMDTPITPLPTLSPTPPLPTPSPTPQYVIIKPVVPEPDTGIKGNRALLNNPGDLPIILYDETNYTTIFKNNLSYNLGNAFSLSFDLKNPPLVIHYKVIPDNITDIKWFEPRDSEKLIDTAIVNRPSEFAWFELKIYNNDSLYDREGWGRVYGIPLSTQEIVLRNPGMYQIEFSGQNVAVNSEVLVKKEGNIMV
jgi:hypothetical protein